MPSNLQQLSNKPVRCLRPPALTAGPNRGGGGERAGNALGSGRSSGRPCALCVPTFRAGVTAVVLLAPALPPRTSVTSVKASSCVRSMTRTICTRSTFGLPAIGPGLSRKGTIAFGRQAPKLVPVATCGATYAAGLKFWNVDKSTRCAWGAELKLVELPPVITAFGRALGRIEGIPGLPSGTGREIVLAQAVGRRQGAANLQSNNQKMIRTFVR